LGWLGVPYIRLGKMIVPYWGAYGFGILAVVWTINLFNFMDGIDGIAATEAIFITIAAALLAMWTGGSYASPAPALVFAAACMGFLLWNWPPAKIFMGDVGSGFIGYGIVVLALAAAHNSQSAIWVWLILGGGFFVDATITLMRRLSRGERVYQAHRTHAYQWLSRRWRSHKRVTMAFLAMDLLWLLPCAWFAAAYRTYAGATALAALVPIACLAIVSGAGRSEAGTMVRSKGPEL